jgi:hypothetical protein
MPRPCRRYSSAASPQRNQADTKLDPQLAKALKQETLKTKGLKDPGGVTKARSIHQACEAGQANWMQAFLARGIETTGALKALPGSI